MNDRISSDSWTGPPDQRLGYARSAPTYGAGQSSATDMYRQLVISQTRPPEPLPPRVRTLFRLALISIPISVLTLWLARVAVGFAISDMPLQVHSDWLVLAAGASLILTAIHFASRSARLVGLRIVMVATTLLGSVGFAGWYVLTTLQAHSRAQATSPVRAFEFVRYEGPRHYRRATYWYQQADGRAINGARLGAVPPFASSCVLVQLVKGDRGFTWIRVLDRSRGPAAEIAWPIRKEECFSDIPLSSLPR